MGMQRVPRKENTGEASPNNGMLVVNKRDTSPASSHWNTILAWHMRDRVGDA